MPTRFLTAEMLAGMSEFSRDVAEVAVEPSTMDHPKVLDYYRRSSRQWE